MANFTLDDLHAFIILAKSKTYVGDGQPSPACRPASHDLSFSQGDFAYLDSYFGGADFIGEEVVYFRGQPVWGENYYGHLLRPDLISAAGVGQILKQSLTMMYSEGRFLGAFSHETPEGCYIDQNEGDLTWFKGVEYVEIHGVCAYELRYHGGMINDD